MGPQEKKIKRSLVQKSKKNKNVIPNKVRNLLKSMCYKTSHFVRGDKMGTFARASQGRISPALIAKKC